MIYAITSRKGGCGRSTISLMLAMMMANDYENNCLLIDLSPRGDLHSLVKVDKTIASIDGVLSAKTLGLADFNVDNNIVNYKGLNMIPGTNFNMANLLENRYMDVKAVLDYLNPQFNSIILDIDFGLYQNLVNLGMEIFPVFVLEQDMLNIQEYKQEIKDSLFSGIYLINKYKEFVFPEFSFFERNFDSSNLVVVEEDQALISILNRREISIKSIHNSPCYPGLKSVCDVIQDKSSVVNAKYLQKYSKKKFKLLELILGNSKVKTKKSSNPKKLRKEPKKKPKPQLKKRDTKNKQMMKKGGE